MRECPCEHNGAHPERERVEETCNEKIYAHRRDATRSVNSLRRAVCGEHSPCASTGTMGSIHICTPSCSFERLGDVYTCVASGYEHVCDASCKCLTIDVSGKHCRLTQKCHTGVCSPSDRQRSPTSTSRVNHKDKFFHIAKSVITSISRVALDESTVDRLAMRCLATYSELKDNLIAYSKISTIKYDYLVLALLYLFKDGVVAPDGSHVVPRLEDVQTVLPNICEVHKCAYDSKRRMPLKVTNAGGGVKEGGVRKRTLTNTSRNVVEALRLVVAERV